MQMMQVVAGGELVEVDGHVAVRHSIDVQTDSGADRREVNSFHRLGVGEAAPGCAPFAWTEEGQIEGFRDDARAWLAIMWHPEREAVAPALDIQLIRQHLGL
jgi:gamma-glutamyl-gamma-aminobutyrate hydrolase PuuD